MDIVLVRVFIEGGSSVELTVETDLAYASSLTCSISATDRYCGAIFGQVVDGQVTIVSETVGGTDREIRYYLTFQKWADY
jgi:hypothetical protein